MFRTGRSIWALVAFLAGFTVLVWLVADRFLLPGMVAASEATPGQKRQLMAFARLLLAIVLMILSVGIILVFQIRRFFFPRPAGNRPQKTNYVDAWAEAGRRTEPPAADE